MSPSFEVRRNAAILVPGADVRRALAEVDVRLTLEEQFSRHKPTFRHSLAIGVLASPMAEVFGLNKRQKNALIRGALLHDAGKNTLAVIEPGLFDTPAPDWNLIKMHPLLGTKDKLTRISPLVKALIENHHRLQGPRSYPKSQINFADKEDPLIPKDAQLRADLEKTLPVLVAMDIADALLGNDRDYLLNPALSPTEQSSWLEDRKAFTRADFGGDKAIFDITWNRVKEIFSTPSYFS